MTTLPGMGKGCFLQAQVDVMEQSYSLIRMIRPLIPAARISGKRNRRLEHIIRARYSCGTIIYGDEVVQLGPVDPTEVSGLQGVRHGRTGRKVGVNIDCNDRKVLRASWSIPIVAQACHREKTLIAQSPPPGLPLAWHLVQVAVIRLMVWQSRQVAPP
jgi:hypothetical protein